MKTNTGSSYTIWISLIIVCLTPINLIGCGKKSDSSQSTTAAPATTPRLTDLGE